MPRSLTQKGAATRDRIIEGAVQLIRTQGAQRVALDDIRAASDTSKSQLFHYFPDGRAGLLLEVARHEAAAVLSDQQPSLAELGAPDSWIRWRDVVIRRYRLQGDRCPLSALTQQLGPGEPSTRPVVADLLGTWHELLADGVRRARPDTGEVDADGAASAILAAIQGGVVMLQVTGSIVHLERALDTALVATGLVPPESDATRRRPTESAHPPAGGAGCR